jgi:CPA1 family monovalent cation:H+ antiporter
VIILITLVAQGLTLAPLIRMLRIAGGNEEDDEERHARRISLRAAGAAIDHFAAEGAGELASATELRQIAASKLQALDGSGSTMPPHLRPRLAMLKAAREAVIGLRDRGEIGDAVMRQLQNEFDHEEVLLRQR